MTSLEFSLGVSGNAQEKWQRTNAYMRDVQKAFRTRPAIRIQGNKRYFKLLLVLSKILCSHHVFIPHIALQFSCVRSLSALPSLKAGSDVFILISLQCLSACTYLTLNAQAKQSCLHIGINLVS